MSAFFKTFKSWLSIIIIGTAGAMLCQTQWATAMEEEWGLASLFQLRGALMAPAKVVVVTVDKASAEMLQLDEDPEKWSRSRYASLVNKLNTYQPKLIAFNLHFAEQRSLKGDANFAKAIAAKQNTLLSSYIKHFSVHPSSELQELNYERIIHPIPLLEKAAIGTAPFPIPRTLSTVKQFWTYKNSVGDIPTLPMAIFQCYLLQEAYPEILQLLQKVDADLYNKLPKNLSKLTNTLKPLEVFQEIQYALLNNQKSLDAFSQQILAANYPTEKKQLLHTWLASINNNRSLYLNYYGGVGSITTIPLYQVLAQNAVMPDVFKDKIVLIGYSTDIEPEKNQGFYTVFSQNGRVNASSVEIAATAVANLMDKSWIKPLPSHYQFLLLMLSGSLLSAIFHIHTYKISLGFTATLTLIYLVTAYYFFKQNNLWLPIFTVLLQIAAILVVESILHLRKIHKVSERYLPKNVFAKNTQNPDDMDDYGELVQGVCMATDAGQYTTLSESMCPIRLSSLMNKYYSTMFPVVKAHNGLISDVIGDSMLALWAKPVADLHLKSDACHAALKIDLVAQQFNQSPTHRLPTRIGLHYGEMRLGNVGALDHYEYRAVGDIVNTASRIEDLNKLLRTHILVSESVIQGLSGFTSREIGLFLLKGKTQAISIFELIGKSDHIDPKIAPLLHAFAKALYLFQTYQWSKAQKAFFNINKYYPNDGPTIFYMHYLKKQLPLQEQTIHTQKPVIEISDINQSHYLAIDVI